MTRFATSLLLVVLAIPTFANAWDGTPRLVAGAATAPTLVGAAPDGAFGTYVAWQDAGGELRAARLDAEGNVDPAPPLVLGGPAASRSMVRLIPDGAGGAYVCWVQGITVRLTRILDGAPAPGWNASGRLLGMLTSAEHRPWLESDGQGGIWVGWFQGARTTMVEPSVRVIHLGPYGNGAAGWPSSARSVPLSPSDDEWVYSASFARAEDGGVWALVATGHVSEPNVTAGDWRLARMTTTGESDPSLPPEGVVVGAFDPAAVGFSVPRIGLGAVNGDGAGGVFAALGQATADVPGSWYGSTTLRRFLGDGSLHAQQPGFPGMGYWYDNSGGSCPNGICALADFSPRLMRDASGDLYAGACEYYTHIGLALRLWRLDEAGGAPAEVAMASGAGVALHPGAAGGFAISTFDPSGPHHAIYDPSPAYVGWFDTRSHASYAEETFSPFVNSYLASDVAPLPDGGAVLVWSRSQVPVVGVYALRLGANGSPLAVEPGPGALARGLRLVREGGALRANWGSGADGEITLHDVAGRVRARIAVGGGAGAADVAPVSALQPGVYFARLARRDGAVERARAVVLR